jgi:hypothetical protein
LREATVVVEKEAKKAAKSGKSKAITLPHLLTKASTTSPSQNPRKQDASFIQLSVSRLQLITSPTLMDSTGGTQLPLKILHLVTLKQLKNNYKTIVDWKSRMKIC